MENITDRYIRDSLRKLEGLENPAVLDIVSAYISLCNPKSIFVCNDSAEDNRYIRDQAVARGEERALDSAGRTIHFDGYFDQARDKAATKYLLSEGEVLSKHINSIDKEKGKAEVLGFLRNSMQDKEMIVCFFCLGPLDSKFSLPALQITDSYYVAHSEMILYRRAYELFKKQKPKKFFKFIHSAGELKGAVSKNVDKRRVYIDLAENTVFSTNTQYAGNTVGLKKLALRLAIKKAAGEDWLAEHMFVTGVTGPGARTTYFTGAFPSGCGKTSTAMLPGEKIIGDDIAYLRVSGQKAYAVNTEVGMFGIIQDVSKESDPLIWDAIKNSKEIIVSNILVTPDNNIRWLNDGLSLPDKGINFSGEWFPGKKDADGKDIPYAHKNARYTVSLKALSNCDPALDDAEGVKIDGIIYGGRDSDTSVPVVESFDWIHGVITCGASLESELTFATLKGEGERKFNPFSNLDFLAIPIGRYISMHLDFGKKLDPAPKIFTVNYFLRDTGGNFLNSKMDKHVWIKWMNLRVHGEVSGIITPLGVIPEYKDLQTLFKEVLDKEYTQEEYVKQFSIRVPQNLVKIGRIVKIYQELNEVPDILFDTLSAQKDRLTQAKEKYGDFIPPESF